MRRRASARSAGVRNSVMRFVAMFVVTLSLFAASCGSGSEASADEQVVASGTAVPPTPPDLEPAVVVSGTGELPPTVVCDGIPLSVMALTEIALLSDRPLLAEAMAPLDEFLATGEGDFWPQDGYWVIDAGDDHYLLAHHDPNGNMTLLGTKRQSDGSWQPTTLQSGRPCELRSELPDGFGIVTLELNAAMAYMDMPVDEPYFEIGVTGQACSGGQPMGDRLVPPQVIETDTAVFITVMAVLPTGPQTCPGNPMETIRIDLREPLGERQIRDALRSGQTLADFVPVSP